MAAVGDVMEGSPGVYASFLIPEPFSSHALNVFRVHVRNSSGEFGSSNQSIEVSGLS